MYYIDNECTDPYMNLATEEYLLKNFSDEFFMLWRNAPSIIVGRNQNSAAEINPDFVSEHNIPVVRRLTGGGAVFHDLGNLNYTFIVNDSESASFDFRKYTLPVIEVLQKLGVAAELSGRNDLTIEGKKFSGNSQYRYRGRLLHHGTLLFSSSITDISSALRVDPQKFEGKGIKSVSSRVTNISSHLKNPLTLPQFRKLLSEHIMESSEQFISRPLTPDDRREISRLTEDKYRKWEWDYGASPEYNFTNKRKYPCGNIQVYMTVNGGVIKGVKIYGDFFGEYDLKDIETALLDKPHEKGEILRALSDFDLGRYFSAMTAEELTELFF
jgi:lipoate-protein ligase A